MADTTVTINVVDRSVPPSDAIKLHSDSLFSKFYKQRYLNQYIFV